MARRSALQTGEARSLLPIGNPPSPIRRSFGGNRQRVSLFFDVDGVIFPGQFMIALARRRGIWSYAQTVTDCLLFNLGRIGLEELLRRSFGRLKGMPWETACEVFRRHGHRAARRRDDRGAEGRGPAGDPAHLRRAGPVREGPGGGARRGRAARARSSRSRAAG